MKTSRRVTAWASAAVCVALLAAMLASGRWMAVWRAPGGAYLGVRRGWLVVGYNTTLGLRGATIRRHTDGLSWSPGSTEWIDKKTGRTLFRYWYLPLWMIAAAAGAPAAFAAWRSARSAVWRRRGRCGECGYELGEKRTSREQESAAKMSRCPECGTVR